VVRAINQSIFLSFLGVYDRNTPRAEGDW
jgi:hypothetical protein